MRRKTSLLKFDSVHVSEGGTKEPLVLNEFDQMLLLLVKDM